jgi:hypothetical protein
MKSEFNFFIPADQLKAQKYELGDKTYPGEYKDRWVAFYKAYEDQLLDPESSEVTIEWVKNRFAELMTWGNPEVFDFECEMFEVPKEQETESFLLNGTSYPLHWKKKYERLVDFYSDSEEATPEQAINDATEMFPRQANLYRYQDALATMFEDKAAVVDRFFNLSEDRLTFGISNSKEEAERLDFFADQNELETMSLIIAWALRTRRLNPSEE